VDFPDYGKIADAFGIKYVKVQNKNELNSGVSSIFSEDAPYIIEIITDPDQFDLHNALVMYGKRKVGFRPIEDQSPFIDREVFFEEMIIAPHETSYGKPI
jgi:acetolactate synthase-1/2/3 large subunit